MIMQKKKKKKKRDQIHINNPRLNCSCNSKQTWIWLETLSCLRGIGVIFFSSFDGQDKYALTLGLGNMLLKNASNVQ